MTRSSRSSDAASSAAFSPKAPTCPTKPTSPAISASAATCCARPSRCSSRRACSTSGRRPAPPSAPRNSGICSIPEVLAWEAAGDLHLPYAFNFTEFRLIVEPKASFLAAKRATDAEIQVIRDCCDALEACVGHLDRMPDADIAFHQSIHRASHNALLQHLSVLTAAIMRVQVTYTASKPGDFERGLPLHRELTEAITARDAPSGRKRLACALRDALSRSRQPRRPGRHRPPGERAAGERSVSRYPVSQILTCPASSTAATRSAKAPSGAREEQAVYWLDVPMPSSHPSLRSRPPTSIGHGRCRRWSPPWRSGATAPCSSRRRTG